MITVYASSTASPQQSIDHVIDLNGGDTLPQNIQLHGSASDSADAGATFSWSWAILDKPAGSNAALSSTVAQNPIINGVDVWGTYRLMLVATNTSTNENSQNDPILAPASAFVLVRVKSSRMAIEKPAKGQRNWQDRTNAWADAIEAGGDVAAETPIWSGGVQGSTLTFSGTANEIEITGAKPNVVIGIPSTVALGDLTADTIKSKAGIELNSEGGVPGSGQTEIVVDLGASETKLAYDHGQARWEIDGDKVIDTGDVEDAGENSAGKILSRERLIFTQCVDGDHIGGESTFTPADGIGKYESTNKGIHTIVLFKNHWANKIYIEKVSAVVGHGGKVGTGDDYEFEVVTAATSDKVRQNVWTAVNPAGTVACSQAHNYGPSVGDLSQSIEVSGGEYFGLRCTKEPQELGRNLYVTIQAYREIG